MDALIERLRAFTKVPGFQWYLLVLGSFLVLVLPTLADLGFSATNLGSLALPPGMQGAQQLLGRNGGSAGIGIT